MVKYFKAVRHPHIILLDIPRVVMIIFIIFNLIAMTFYSGGNVIDPSAPGYSISKNFFSDLGRTTSYSNHSNWISFFFFNTCIVLSGMTFVLFFFEFFLLFRRNVVNRYIAMFGTLFGLLGGCCLIGVALFPIDLDLEAHRFCAKWTFRFFFPCTLLYSITLFRSKRFHNSMAYGYLFWSLFVAAYVVLSELGPGLFNTEGGLIFQVISQKIIVFTFILNVLYQTFHINTFFKSRQARLKKNLKVTSSKGRV